MSLIKIYFKYMGRIFNWCVCLLLSLISSWMIDLICIWLITLHLLYTVWKIICTWFSSRLHIHNEISFIIIIPWYQSSLNITGLLFWLKVDHLILVQASLRLPMNVIVNWIERIWSIGYYGRKRSTNFQVCDEFCL